MQTRRKIFETNSSSSHSVVVTGDPEFVKIDEEDLEKDKILIYGDDYYCYAYDEGGGHDWKEVAMLAYIFAKSMDDEHVKMLEEVIEEYTKKPVDFKMSDEEYSPSPCHSFRQFFNDKETLKKAIFMSPGVMVLRTSSEC